MHGIIEKGVAAEGEEFVEIGPSETADFLVESVSCFSVEESGEDGEADRNAVDGDAMDGRKVSGS